MCKAHHLLRRYLANEICGDIRIWVTHSLRGEPVRAVAAMKIAAEHSKCQRVRARHHMKERLLFDRVTLQRGYIPAGYAQLAALIEPHLTYPAPPFTDLTAMSAGITQHRFIFEFFI